MAAKVAEETSYRRVVLTTAGLDVYKRQVEEQVPVAGRVQVAVSAALAGYRLHDEGKVPGAQARRVGATGGYQHLRSGAARSQCLPQDLEVGTGRAGPVLDHLTKPRDLDIGEVDDSLPGGPAASRVCLLYTSSDRADLRRYGHRRQLR